MTASTGLSPSPKSSQDHPEKHTTSKSKRKPHNDKKSVSRPAVLSRRSTPQYLTRLGTGKREEKRDSDGGGDDDETFLNYCSYCEKQIHSSNSHHLYCSEACQRRDHADSQPTTRSIKQHESHEHHVPFSSSSKYTSPPRIPFNSFTYSVNDGPDIVPRASPTISRPRSYFGGEGFPVESGMPSAMSQVVSSSLPQSKHYSSNSRKGSSSALASLRELNSALDSNRRASQRETVNSRRGSRDDSSLSGSDENDSPMAGSPISRNASQIWNYMTFASTSTQGGTALAPSSRPTTASAQSTRAYSTSSSINGAAQQISYSSHGVKSASQHRLSACNVSTTALGTGASSVLTAKGDPYGYSRTLAVGNMDRPLPPRSGAYAHRPKSVDLVTPFGGVES